MKRLARWSVQHRLVVLILWLVALLGATLVSQAVGAAYNSNFDLPHTESTAAFALLRAAEPKLAGDTEQVVFAVDKGTLDNPVVRAKIEKTLTELKKLPHVGKVISPYGPLGAHQINGTRTVAFAQLIYSLDSPAVPLHEAQEMVKIVAAANGGVLHAAVGGQVSEQANVPSIGGVGPGILLAGLVLLFVFGSLYAMALPLLSAVLSLGTAVGLISLLSHVMKMPPFALDLVLLVGLGVGVDYALFIVTRHRQGLMAGHSVPDSITTAVNTSGRAVLFAGIIVCIALLGMLALGVDLLYGLAIAASLGVLLTMIAALTLLPALLSFIGPRVLSRKQRRRLKESGPLVTGSGSVGFWARWADFIKKRPLVPALVALCIVGLLAAPFFSMRLGTSDQGNDPSTTSTYQAYTLLAKGFGPGFNGPLQLVALTHTARQAAIVSHAFAEVAKQKGVAAMTPTLFLPGANGGKLAVALLYPTTSPESSRTTDLIHTLRTTTLPAATKGTHVHILVGGITAIFVDFAAVLSQKIPLFIGLVVLLSFLLLALVFRSILIPITAACMNLLSIAAAFGIVTAVFQWGWLSHALGTNMPGPVEAFLPVMMFAILFGLSMDYEVFLISRIHEEWLHTNDNSAAVRNGLAATGKTITAAALIMILVFGAFLLGDLRIIKEFGLGLAVGVFVDAVMIRMAIVPAVMGLLGRANWWFPHWLDSRLPRLAIEPDGAQAVDEDSSTRGPDV